MWGLITTNHESFALHMPQGPEDDDGNNTDVQSCPNQYLCVLLNSEEKVQLFRLWAAFLNECSDQIERQYADMTKE